MATKGGFMFESKNNESRLVYVAYTSQDTNGLHSLVVVKVFGSINDKYENN
jgi:hypothetical protein